MTLRIIDRSQHDTHATLLSPFALGGRPLRNRVVYASISTLMAEAGSVTDRLIRYYANRARGGTALIVSEPMSIAAHQDTPKRVRAFDDSHMDGLSRWAEAVESQDCRLLAQLMERGRGRNIPGRTLDAIGASALPDELSWTMPRALRTSEVERLIEEFAQSAHRLERCGFSGVEISAAHGHFFHQFLSPWSNVRTDKYGGDVVGRTRLVADLVQSIRARCGSNFIVGLKLPGDDGVNGSIDVEQAASIASQLTSARNVDYVCFAQGNHARSLEQIAPDAFGPRLPYLPLLRSLRETLHGVALVALGRISDPDEADAIIARGDAELVALGRALVADPAWVIKAAAQRAEDIRYCVACNTCYGRVSALQLPLACDNNPRVADADEVDFRPARVNAKRRIVIVGAGVAGLEAAWVAAARGHDVTVFGRSTEAGGKARLRALLPGGEPTANIYRYQLAAARKAGVRFELGMYATYDHIAGLHPDTVILASGSSMVRPSWLSSEWERRDNAMDLRQAIVKLLTVGTRQPGVAVIFDMDHSDGTYAAVEWLHDVYDRAVVITPRDSIASETPLVVRQGILRRFNQKRIEVITLSEPLRTQRPDRGALQYANLYNNDACVIEDVGLVTWSTPRIPEIALCESLQQAQIEVRVIGDCKSARDVLAATSEGHWVGNVV